MLTGKQRFLIVLMSVILGVYFAPVGGWLFLAAITAVVSRKIIWNGAMAGISLLGAVTMALSTGFTPSLPSWFGSLQGHFGASVWIMLVIPVVVVVIFIIQRRR